jgi:hypothetical protein
MLSAESMAEIEDLEELTADTGLLAGNNRLNQVPGVLQRIGQRSQPRAHQGDRLDRSVVWIHRETARHICFANVSPSFTPDHSQINAVSPQD